MGCDDRGARVNSLLTQRLSVKKPLDPGTDSSLYNAHVMSNESPERSVWRVGELAKASGVSPDTLRHYERKGLLPFARRSSNGYREYSPRALDRILLVRRALAVGFSLDELAGILKVRDRGGAPCREVRAMAVSKLSELEIQLQELLALRDYLRKTVKHWDERLSKTDVGEQAGLLEALAKQDRPELRRVSRVKQNLKRKKVRR
jgi:DNA-binding transcriptional MerR regulator